MSYLLFLDDIRKPADCKGYMKSRTDVKIYDEPWVLVKNYKEFCHTIAEKGLPKLVSFDHDLWDEFEQDEYLWRRDDQPWGNPDKTGYDCAVFLVNYCLEKNLNLPQYIVHSMNPVGARKITNTLEDFYKIKSQ